MNADTPFMFRPLRRMPIMKAPIIVPEIVPTPPDRYAPPITAEDLDLMRAGASEMIEHASTERDGRRLLAAVDALAFWLEWRRPTPTAPPARED